MQAQPAGPDGGPGTQIGGVETWFDAVGVTSITDSLTGDSDNFSIQLNTNYFLSSVCNTTPGCQNAWEQFVFVNSSGDDNGKIYIEYWLRFATSCPSGWSTAPSGLGCYLNSVASSGIPDVTTSLSDITFYGDAVSGTDYVTFETPTEAWETTGADSTLGLDGKWTSVQSNIFGQGNGSQANFNSGVFMTVYVSVGTGYPGGYPAAACHGGSPTAETNNLNLQPPSALGASDSYGPFSGGPGCCPFSGPPASGGGITFFESNTEGSWLAPYCLLNNLDAILVH